MTVLFIRANRISPVAKNKRGGNSDSAASFRNRARARSFFVFDHEHEHEHENEQEMKMGTVRDRLNFHDAGLHVRSGD
jgi:hypothetical protein